MNKPFIYLILFYKKYISPYLPQTCRFYPSCSEYSLLAFQNFPIHKALYLSIHRILRCNPLSEGYNDPIPLSKKKEKRQ